MAELGLVHALDLLCHGAGRHHVPGNAGEPAVRQILDVLWNFLERDESRASSILISFLVEEVLS